MQKRTPQPTSILLVTSGRPGSACTTEQQTLLKEFLADRGWLQTLGQLPEAQGNNRSTGPWAALDLLRRFVRSSPRCDIVHCHLSEPGSWALLVVIQTLIARFFGKPLLVDLHDSIDRVDDESLPITLRMILALSALRLATWSRWTSFRASSAKIELSSLSAKACRPSSLCSSSGHPSNLLMVSIVLIPQPCCSLMSSADAKMRRFCSCGLAMLQCLSVP